MTALPAAVRVGWSVASMPATLMPALSCRDGAPPLPPLAAHVGAAVRSFLPLSCLFVTLIVDVPCWG
ncbi:hypothetical protein Scep_009659 [Stephania cephalantha]|uniref:Uncharacterized protein n=1 Tax=Stephania cephalantha TaxID=152367 RepID=A0AAP0JTK6_9MAGN